MLSESELHWCIVNSEGLAAPALLARVFYTPMQPEHSSRSKVVPQLLIRARTGVCVAMTVNNAHAGDGVVLIRGAGIQHGGA